MISMINENITKPCLRWAGGKTWLIKYLPQIIGNISFENYHEPFLGGASIFLSIRPQKQAFLSDLNEELIKTYIALRDTPHDVIRVLYTYSNDRDSYYKIRNEQPQDEITRAARFIYLNQTSYNGIYRVNLNGEYNVPYGFRKKEFLNE